MWIYYVAENTKVLSECLWEGLGVPWVDVGRLGRSLGPAQRVCMLIYVVDFRICLQVMSCMLLCVVICRCDSFVGHKTNSLVLSQACC